MFNYGGVLMIRIGLIGCGGIGQLRAKAIAQLPSVKLSAVADINDACASVVGNSYDAFIASDWQSLLKRDDIDLVVLSTPPLSHTEIGLAALEAGKHLLCEKPLARDSDECRLLVKAASQARRILATGFNYRFYPSVMKARELLDSGLIGEVSYIRSYGGYSATEHGHPWIHDYDTMGGGALRDIGIHLIDLTRYFLGEIEQVTGFATNRIWGFNRCEDDGFLLMRSSEGRIASLHASWTERRRYRFQIDICGTLGIISLSCFPMIVRAAWTKQLDCPTRSRSYFFPMVHIMEKLKSYRWVVIQSFIRELEAFAATIRGERTHLASGYDGLRSIELAEAVVNDGRFRFSPRAGDV
jgi:predicted dehydrogenase